MATKILVALVAHHTPNSTMSCNGKSCVNKDLHAINTDYSMISRIYDDKTKLEFCTIS